MFVCPKHFEYSQVLASRSHAFSMHSQENVKKNLNPFPLFVMDSQKFERTCKNIASIFIRHHFFLVFLQGSLTVLSFSANLPRISNFHIRRDIHHSVTEALCCLTLDAVLDVRVIFPICCLKKDVQVNVINS